MSDRIRFIIGISAALVLSAASAFAQIYGNRLGQREGGEVVYRSVGAKTIMNMVEPLRKKRFLPQELYQENRWQTWRYTNYASDPYRNYVDPNLRGDYFYDVYGNFLTRGWLVYNWTETHPRISGGSSLLKRGEYSGFFTNLIIASDQKGDHSFSITIGDELFTTLTPLTFRKTVFNGTQIDYASGFMEATGIFSRLSNPGFITDVNPIASNDYTNLAGGRARFLLGDFVRVGGTYVSSYGGRASIESFEGNPFKGELTSGQLQDQIAAIVIRLSDDSPADDTGGAVLLADDVEIVTQIGDRDTVLTGNAIGFRPQRRGGTIREGVRTANGIEQITLRYELTDLLAILDDPDAVNNIRELRFRLILVNDYKVEITSDRQTNSEGQPIFLLVTQAEGNIQDGSNKREVSFNYGLPTANQIFGFTLEVEDFKGFDLYAEIDVNNRYHKYPSRRANNHKARSGTVGDESAQAWIVNLSRFSYPWHFFAEAFSMDEDYSTSSFIVDGSGRIDYEDETFSLFDFVDDNDDQDRKPDQERRYQDPRTPSERGNAGRSARGFADEAVFPGWDQNRDFISDFNQNSTSDRENRFPDYDEPFLRYNTDRPEYFFGIDLNNNGWVDHFENDNAPDYPYKRDHKGYNVFLRYHVLPELQVTGGQTREQLISDDRENVTTYAFAAFEKDYPILGTVRFFDMIKKAEDDIQDDLVQWVQLPGLTGSHVTIEDPLSARDTWINTAWLGWERRTNLGVNFSNKFKYETLNQGKKGKSPAFKENTRFLGIVNKVDYLRHFGRLTARPKFKSELLRDNTPFSMGGVRQNREQWTGTFFFIVDFPVLWRTNIEIGLEQMFFQDVLLDEDDLVPGDFTEDFRSTALAMQLSNRKPYLGYMLTTQVGFILSRTGRERVDMGDKSRTDSFLFLTMYAGLSE